jgi:RNA polymerase sigma-70 factor (ECF subfamily)
MERAAAERNAPASLTLDDLVVRFSKPLTSYFRRRVGPEEDVADLVQEVFVRVARLPDINTIEVPDRFLFVVAANTLRDRARRLAARGHPRYVPIDGLEIESADFSAFRVLVGREAITQVEKALRELPERTRDVLILKLFEEYRMADVASAMGISKRAAEKHYAKALLHLQTRLEDWKNR